MFLWETDSSPRTISSSDISPYSARLGLQLGAGLVGLGLG